MKLQQARFHFVGVGGIGMCGLAELLHNMGSKVSGSDISENANVDHLRELGIKVIKGHKADNIGDADVVVYSSAVPTSNPEVAAARAKGIPLIPRAEALAEIMRLKKGIAIAGTHGKTTTTSMVAALFLSAKLSPTLVIGGRFAPIKSTAYLGQGDWLVAEADESDGSFQKLSPEIAVITNIDADHLDHYKTFDNLQKAFFEFALKVPFYGILVVCGDDPVIRELFASYPKRILSYGFKPENDLILRGENGRYEVFERLGESLGFLGELRLKVPGRHNALNALAAFAAGRAAGVPVDEALRGLETFEGVDRRFHFKGEKAGIAVYDDYGHHPTEVRAVLQAFREKYPDRRLVVYFQPHRYSRTEHCWHEFLSCFSQADELILTDIYPAGEAARPGITAERLASEMKHDHVTHLPREDVKAENLLPRLRAGDVFLTLGAGDGWKLGLEILGKL